MADEEESDAGESEEEKVENWRRYELLVAGYPDKYARRLARLHHVDLHEAIHLLETGCDPKTAYKILR